MSTRMQSQGRDTEVHDPFLTITLHQPALPPTGSVEDVVLWGSTHGYDFDVDSLREGVIDLVISDS